MSRFTPAITISAIALFLVGGFWFARGESALPDLPSAAPVSIQPFATYTDPVYNFSFEYPADLDLTEEDSFGELMILGDLPNGETYLIVDVSPYDFDQPFTADFLPLNVLGLSSEIDQLTLPSGANAFLFRRTDTPIGPTRDAVFVQKGQLFHIAVTAPLEDAFHSILESWRLEPAVTQ